jgi:hypothetical protein
MGIYREVYLPSGLPFSTASLLPTQCAFLFPGIMKLSLLALVGFVAYASAAPAPSSSYVVREKRETQHQRWSRRDVQVNRDAVIPMSVGLTQRNLDKGYDFLMDVSHPRSPNYGKHWSLEKVINPRNLQ